MIFGTGKGWRGDPLCVAACLWSSSCLFTAGSVLGYIVCSSLLVCSWHRSSFYPFTELSCPVLQAFLRARVSFGSRYAPAAEPTTSWLWWDRMCVEHLPCLPAESSFFRLIALSFREVYLQWRLLSYLFVFHLLLYHHPLNILSKTDTGLYLLPFQCFHHHLIVAYSPTQFNLFWIFSCLGF